MGPAFDLKRWVEAFEEPPSAPEKVLPLAEAVRRAVRPGMTLHFTFGHNRPTASILEVLRQFRGTEPDFTMAMLFTAGPAIALLTEGLVKRLVTTLVCEPYPAPAPCRPAQREVKAGRLSIEQWGVLSYVARLEAAARGFSDLPVRSLLGSSLHQENGEHIIPPAPGDSQLRVRPLVPDISFVHGPAADCFGNVLLSPPYGEGAWGAFAARHGVVATVERLVSSETLRRHADLLVIPASHVASVSVVPFGAHPAGLSAGGIEGVEPYGDDVAAYKEARAAGATEESWKAWVEQALLTVDHDEYLTRLGAERLLFLKGKARPDSWRAELLSTLTQTDFAAPASRPEGMAVAASQLLIETVERLKARAILSGLGAGNLAAWLANTTLRRQGVALVAELGMYGYEPRPCDPFVFNFRNLATCTRRTDASMALGVLLGGAQARGVGALGAGQIDAHGRFNSTRLGNGALLVGSGGANDVASLAEEVVIALPAGRHRLVEKLPYVTGPGERVTAVVTDLGVFEKPRGNERLRLTRLVGPLIGGQQETHIKELAARTEFAFEVAPTIKLLPPPSSAELGRLRLHDPERAFLRDE